jgi:hypothetical protein
MAEPSKAYGPKASEAYSMLNEENRKLFDWFTERLKREPLFFASMLQGNACYYPKLSYWELVERVKTACEQPCFEVLRQEALKEVKEDLKRPLN